MQRLADARAEADLASLTRVELRPDEQHGPLAGRIEAQHAQLLDPHRTGLVDDHVTPDATRVPVRVDAVPVLEHPGQVALRLAVVLRLARELDGQKVFRSVPQLIADLERVGGEVALSVAQVGAVEPHVALVEEPCERDPGAATLGGCRDLERPPMQHRRIVRGERRRGAPVPGDRQVGPARVVKGRVGEGPPELVVGDVRSPHTGQFEHCGRRLAAPGERRPDDYPPPTIA